MGTDQPYLYSSSKYDARSPAHDFDPKAVTRASYAAKTQRTRHDGPLISFNRHPE